MPWRRPPTTAILEFLPMAQAAVLSGEDVGPRGLNCIVVKPEAFPASRGPSFDLSWEI